MVEAHKEKTNWLAPLIGIVFVSVILATASFYPNPTNYQFFVYRAVLGVAVAGLAASIPGFLKVEIPRWITASGAIAVFVIVYFFTPSPLVQKSTSQSMPSQKPPHLATPILSQPLQQPTNGILSFLGHAFKFEFRLLTLFLLISIGSLVLASFRMKIHP
jgi:hypothetical protein